MIKSETIIGQTFGRLLVIGPSSKRNKSGSTFWQCQCDCGEITDVSKQSLKSGHTQSCGCLRLERCRAKITKHGHNGAKGRSPEYCAWHNAKRRCLLPQHPEYKNYGERGITMCFDWVNNFSSFIAHIGPRPSNKHTLDRIDNDGNYEPGNVRWVLRAAQLRNRRNNVWFTFQGETKVITDWATQFNINLDTLSYRLKHKWPDNQMFSPASSKHK